MLSLILKTLDDSLRFLRIKVMHEVCSNHNSNIYIWHFIMWRYQEFHTLHRNGFVVWCVVLFNSNDRDNPWFSCSKKESRSLSLACHEIYSLEKTWNICLKTSYFRYWLCALSKLEFNSFSIQWNNDQRLIWWWPFWICILIINRWSDVLIFKISIPKNSFHKISCFLPDVHEVDLKSHLSVQLCREN